MIIYHFGGYKELTSLEELNLVLSIRYGDGVNEFLLAGETKYPCLAIMVNGDYATVAYISDNEEYLLQSVGGKAGLNPDETTVFYTGTPEQELQVWNEFVITFEDAEKAANEFFTTLKLPECIEWSKA